MAFYNHNFYRDDCDQYNLDLYSVDTYNSAAAQALMAYSSYEFKGSNFIDYGAYDHHVQSEPVISYSTSFFSEPKVIEYDPSTHYIDGDYYNLMQTRYIVSYSTIDFNEDDDVDYDPTPYGGGYDPSLTYGKPLSPSNEICYPRAAAPENSKAPSMDGLSNETLALPSGKEEVAEELEKPQVEEANKDHDIGNDEKGMITASDEQDKAKDENFIGYRPIWSDYDYGYGNGRNDEDHSYEYGKQLPQTPHGHGSNAMDLCESIFGYWPFSSKKDEESYGSQGVYHGDRNNLNQWKGTADYLFGTSNSCGDWRLEAGMYDSPIFGYERHYQEPLQHGQIQYDEHLYDCRVSENEF